MNKDQEYMLSYAIYLASKGHLSQKDKGGFGYILHPLKVMYKLKTDDPELRQIAVLHDYLEDTDATRADLEHAGFSQRVVTGVVLMTKTPGITQEEYEAAICENLDTILVKKEDVRHNMDARRLKGHTQKDYDRMTRYQILYNRLTVAENKFLQPKH